MAFKMKGSPHKMGGIQGTSGHTSALKQKVDNTPDGLRDLGLTEITDADLDADAQLETLPKDKYNAIVAKYIRGGELTEEEEAIMAEYAKNNPPKESSSLKMKSPLEQKKIIEGIKKFGKKVKELGDKYDTGEKVAEGVKKAVKKKVAEYKPKSETTVSTETKKGQTKNKGTDNEYSQDKVKVTASTKTNKKKLFGGKKETTSSSSKVYDQDTYADGDVERGYGDDTKRGVTTTTHSRNKRRGGGKKKVVTVDQSTGKKTITRYRKDGSVKSTKVKKGDYKTNAPTAEKKAIKEENKGK
jgi:hypothetical protein